MANRTILWERQFDPRENFEPVPPDRPRTRYVICTTPRSGSHLLGHLLHSTGAYGYPLEYLHGPNLQRWISMAQAAGQSDPWRYIQSVRTSPNGVFGLKIHHNHLERFLSTEARSEILGYRFIWLRRRDLAAQAVSVWRAASTGSWISDVPEADTAVYSFPDIHRHQKQLRTENARWEAFFETLRIDPLDLCYEDLAANPGATVRRVADFIGVPLPDRATEGFLPERQSGGLSLEWRDRYVGEIRTRFLAGSDLFESLNGARRRTAVRSALVGARHAAGRVRRQAAYRWAV